MSTLPSSNCDTVAVGSLTQEVVGSAFTGTLSFDDVPSSVSGVAVNFGDPGSPTYVGSMVFTGAITSETTTSFHAESAASDALIFDGESVFSCALNGGVYCSIMVTLSNLSGTVTALLPAGLTFTVDATDSGNGLHFTGMFTMVACSSEPF
jgi:hypothetical protein